MKSTVDRILTLIRLHDFRTGQWFSYGAYMDFRKALDSVNRDVLWRFLALCGIPPKLEYPRS